MCSKSIETNAVFTKNEWTINLVQISISIQRTYSNMFSTSQNMETLLIWLDATPLHFF